WLVRMHESLKEPGNLRESKLKRILAAPGIDDLLDLHTALALASDGNTAEVEYCRNYLKSAPAGPINPAPLISGSDLVQHRLKPGVHCAMLLENVRDAQLDGLVRSKTEALEWVDRQLASGAVIRPVGRPRDADSHAVNEPPRP